MEFLNDNDVYPGVHYKSNTEYNMYSFGKDNCPNASKLHKEINENDLLYVLNNNLIGHQGLKLFLQISRYNQRIRHLSCANSFKPCFLKL